MCGVVAYATEEAQGADLGVLSRIFEQSKIRGLHSAGFSWTTLKQVRTEKFRSVTALNERLRDLWESLEGEPVRLIGHTRYSTSGDWQEERNNQPLDLGEIALAFNGCIHMGLRPEYEAVYGRTYVTDNDGEIFCRKVLDGEDWTEFVASAAFSFAGAFLHAGELWVVRNKRRPLWEGIWGQARYIASTRDIFSRAVFPGSIREVEPCRAFRLTA